MRPRACCKQDVSASETGCRVLGREKPRAAGVAWREKRNHALICLLNVGLCKYFPTGQPRRVVCFNRVSRYAFPLWPDSLDAQTFLVGRILPDGREPLSNEPHTLTTNMGATTSHCEEAEPVEVRPSAVVVSSPYSRRSIFLVERRASVREEKKP
jgi:hypothetical protein